MAGRIKEEETSLVSEPLRKYNTRLNGVEKSWRNGSSDGKINVQCHKLLEWPVSNAKMLKM